MSLLTEVLHKTHFEHWSGEELTSFNPVTGQELGRVRLAEEEDYDDMLWDAVKTFERWRLEPARPRVPPARKTVERGGQYRRFVSQHHAALDQGGAGCHHGVREPGARRGPLRTLS